MIEFNKLGNTVLLSFKYRSEDAPQLHGTQFRETSMEIHHQDNNWPLKLTSVRHHKALFQSPKQYS